MSREMFTCPACDRPVWLPADAPTGTPCPHCGRPLGVLSPDSSQDMWLPWDLTNIESIDLTSMVPAVDALESVPESLARELRVFPVDLVEDKLTLAVPSDVNSDDLDRLRFIVNRDLRPVLASESDIQSAIELWYR